MRSIVVIIVTIVTVVLLAACHERIEHQTPDASPDAPPDSSGSGAMASSMEPSPRDFNLELVVLGASLIVAVGPIRDVRRRRRALRDSVAGKPQF